MKKSARKNNRYNGNNVFGQRCVVKTVKLVKEAALEQLLKIAQEVELAQTEGKRLEYTVDWTDMTEAEAMAVCEKIARLMGLRAMCA